MRNVLVLLALGFPSYAWNVKARSLPSIQTIATEMTRLSSLAIPADSVILTKPLEQIPSAMPSFVTNKDRNIKKALALAYNKYLTLSTARPFVTKGITSAVTAGLSNVLSQKLQFLAYGTSAPINLVQVGAFTLTGLFLTGPFYHVWYSMLWRMGRAMERRNLSSAELTVVQIVVDLTLGISIFYPSYFFVYEVFEALVGMRAPLLLSAYVKCSEQLIGLMLASWYVWPVANWVVFRHVPESLRVLATNVLSLFWNAFFCTRVA